MYFDFSKTYAVVVSGVTPCGHMLLNTGGLGGWYFHVAGVYKRPKVMGERGYRRYLLENQKIELSPRTFIPIPYPEKSNKKLEEIMQKKWLWGILPHNCVVLVEEIIQAGGANFGLYSNCPAIERLTTRSK